MSAVTANSLLSDRLGVALILALLAHGLVLLGISFVPPDTAPPAPEHTLDIVVVRNPAPEKKPDKADLLAQSSQQGGGESEKSERITAPPTRPTLAPEPVRRVQQQAQASEDPARAKLITQDRSEHKVVQAPAPEPKPKQRKKANMDHLLASTQKEIDLLTAEMDRRLQTQSKRTRRLYLNSSTQEYKYAAYLEAWRKKVERVGNLNYPDEAKQKKLYGNLLLHVAVRADGSIEGIRLVRSSGEKVLDDAAIRIVRMAAPYAPFPPDIRKEVDVLDITRTWQFLSGNRLFSSQ